MGIYSAPKAPAAPDPAATAAAQTGSNIATAQANGIMQNVNQVTPDGTLTYKQTGSQFVADPTGGTMYYRGPNGEISTTRPTVQTQGAAGTTTRRVQVVEPGTGKISYRTETVPGQATTISSPAEGWTEIGKGYYIPQTTATQTLSQQQQAIKDQEDAAQLNMGTIANQQSAFLKDYLSKPITIDNEATENRLMELGRKRLDPALASRRSATETQLANQGIRIGSTAYDTAMRSLNEGENDAYNQLALTGRQQAVQELLTERNQPLNEITALLSGAQVSQPQFVNAAQPQIANTDYAGLVQSNYANRMAAYQQQNANRNSMIGGLFSLGSSAIMASDRRLKTGIRMIGEGPFGIAIYAFRYIWGGPERRGVMAQDVARVMPDAVVRMADGFLAVDYGKVFAEGAA